MPLDSNLDLFAAEKTNVYAFSGNLWYSLISFQISLFRILSVTPESIRKSIQGVVEKLFSYDQVFLCIYF